MESRSRLHSWCFQTISFLKKKEKLFRVFFSNLTFQSRKPVQEFKLFYQLFSYKDIFSKKKTNIAPIHMYVSQEKNKISLSPKIPCEMCMHELLLGSSPNYEKQIGAMAQLIHVDSFARFISSSKLASLFFTKISCKYSLSVSQFCLYRVPPQLISHLSHPAERGRESEKTNIFTTSPHHQYFLIMRA